MKAVRPTTRLHCLLLILFISLVAIPVTTQAQNGHEAGVRLDKIPARIIRPCCTFGYDMKLWGIPFVNIDQVIGLDELGEHRYLGHRKEGTGTIYTHKGGFIDLGHLRDQIDWTRFLYASLLDARGKGTVTLRLHNEAGRKRLYLNVPAQLSDEDCILLAGKITYDLSLWHEISTWFGASTIPLISEQFSSFSVEDVYSNLLGIHVGMEVLGTSGDFNEVATQTIAATLENLAVVQTTQETYDAYDAVNGSWYTDTKRIPSNLITLQRDLDILTKSTPWLVPNETARREEAVVLQVPLLDKQGALLTKYYEFTIDLNDKIPVAAIFPSKTNRIINQNDFGVLIERIRADLDGWEAQGRGEKK